MFFFVALPEIFDTVNNLFLSFNPPHSLASLTPCDHFSQKASILSGAFSKAWLLFLSLISSVLILAEAPVFSCQTLFMKFPGPHLPQLPLSEPPAMSPSPSEQFHWLIFFTMAPEVHIFFRILSQ